MPTNCFTRFAASRCSRATAANRRPTSTRSGRAAARFAAGRRRAGDRRARSQPGHRPAGRPRLPHRRRTDQRQACRQGVVGAPAGSRHTDLCRARPRACAITSFRESLALLATRRFGTFWFASLLSSIGTWAQQVAEPWLLLTLGASSFLIGLDSFAMDAPVWLLTLVGGIARRSLRPPARDRAVPVDPDALPDRDRRPAGHRARPAVDDHRALGRRRRHRRALDAVVSVDRAVDRRARADRPRPRAQLDAVQPLAHSRTVDRRRAHVERRRDRVLRGQRGVVRAVHRRRAVDSPAAGRPPPGGRRVRRTRRVRSPASATSSASRRCAVRCSPCSPPACSARRSSRSRRVLVKDVFHGDAGRFSIAVASFGVGGLLGATGLLGAASTVDRRRLSSGFALAYGAVLVATALVPWLLGAAAAAGPGRRVDDRQQHLGEHAAAGDRRRAPPGTDGQPLHARGARRHLARRAVDRRGDQRGSACSTPCCSTASQRSSRRRSSPEWLQSLPMTSDALE